MELDELRNPQRVALEAQSMGMVIPAAPVFLDLATGRTSGVRTPATRENAIQLLPPAPVVPAVLAPDPTVVVVPPTTEATTETPAAGEQPADARTSGQGRNKQGEQAGQEPQPMTARARRSAPRHT